MQGTPLTTDQKAAFIKKLRLTGGNISKAAKAAGISRGAAYTHKKEDANFGQAWEEAIAAGADDLEEELRRRALKGVRKPVFQGGKLVGHLREYSDGIGLAMLRAKKPEYRDKSSQDITLKFSEMTDEELEAIARDGEK